MGNKTDERTKTVRDLKMQVSLDKSAYGRVPSFLYLSESGIPLVAQSHFGADNDIFVYDNGYVAYREGEHKTVFLLQDVADSYLQYGSDGDKLPWDYHLMLVGSDRIFSNICLEDRKHSIGSHEIKDFNMTLHDRRSIDPLEAVVRDESWEELMKNLTEKQSKVIRLLIEEKCSQIEISEALGMSQTSVNNMVLRAFTKLKKALA